MHALHRMLVDAASGTFPPVDGAFDVMAPEPAGDLAVAEFTGHSVVLADVDRAELEALGADGFGGASGSDVIRHLAGPHGAIGSHDAVLVTRGTGSGAPTLSRRHDLDDHPRVVRSRAHRRDVEVFGDGEGLVTLGVGLVGRREMSVELLDPATAGAGRGRALIALGLGLVPDGELVWAQVAPGNAASLRAFLACGFVPIGAETLITPAR